MPAGLLEKKLLVWVLLTKTVVISLWEVKTLTSLTTKKVTGYLFKVVNIALENLHTSLLGCKRSNVPNAHCTETQAELKKRIHPCLRAKYSWQYLCYPWSLREGTTPRSSGWAQSLSHRGRACCRSACSASGPTPATTQTITLDEVLHNDV